MRLRTPRRRARNRANDPYPASPREPATNAARRIGDPAARRLYVREACGEDIALAGRVEALLRMHDEDPTFLAAPAEDVRDLLGVPATEGPGAQVGPYHLLRPLGEGGIGTVFLAEQTQPLQRQVAVKVLRPGMDSHQVLARFEQERQALALMDHPNIARVLDAGATPAGRPYFVMELIDGVPITEYCDRARLSIRQRLELFVPVCQAVQHAHQKGVIHRDLKAGIGIAGLLGYAWRRARGGCAQQSGGGPTSPSPAAPGSPSPSSRGP